MRAPARPDAAGTCASRVEKGAFARAFEATLTPRPKTPDAVIRDALVEVRSLADTVPSIIDVPEVIPSQTVSDIEAQSDARVCDAQERPCGEDDAVRGRGARSRGRGLGASSEDGAGDVGSVAAEARAMFGAKEPASSHAGASAEITADLSGMERPRRFELRASYARVVLGDTMELPVVGDDVRVQPQSFLAQPDKLEIRRRETRPAQTRAGDGQARARAAKARGGACVFERIRRRRAANAAGASGRSPPGSWIRMRGRLLDQDARKSDAQPSKDPSGREELPQAACGGDRGRRGHVSAQPSRSRRIRWSFGAERPSPPSTVLSLTQRPCSRGFCGRGGR